MRKINNDLPSIALAMIVLDAEKTIERAIRSTLPLCTQLLVLDTGSKDNTPKICSRMGCEIHFFKWNGSFADARNHLLQFVRTEWVLALDADEKLDTDSFIRNKDLLVNEDTGAIRTSIINELEDGKIQSKHAYPRIYRNHPKIRYEGRIHEQINESILNLGFDIQDSDITIIHYGYSSNDPERIARNRKMLKEELIDSPEDPWLLYHLAETEFNDENFDEAVDFFSKIYDSPMLNSMQKEMSLIRLAQISLRNEDFHGVRHWADFKSRDIDREGLRKFVFAAALLFEQNFELALRLYNSKEVNVSSLVDKEQLENAKNLIKKMSLF